MSDRTTPAPPVGLGPAGRALWDAIVSDLAPGLEFTAKEIDALTHAVRMTDAVEALEGVLAEEGWMSYGVAKQRVVHPAVGEIRQLRLSIYRMLAGVGLEEPEAGRSAKSLAASRAARTRWQGRGSKAADG